MEQEAARAFFAGSVADMEEQKKEQEEEKKKQEEQQKANAAAAATPGGPHGAPSGTGMGGKG
jgi:hypothetical protein